MDRRSFAVIVVFLILLVPSVAAEITYTSTTKSECYSSGRCYITKYSGTMFAQNSQGEWVNPSDIFSITKYQDDITFNYDGIDGVYNITFEAGVIYNGNYYSMSEVKQMKPEINFNFPQEEHDSYYKYAVNISNLDELNIELIENITLTYKSHEGFNLNQLIIKNKRFEIKNTMALYFTDLISKHPISINVGEKRLYISNITDNIVNGNLYLDPSLLLQDPGTENLDDAKIVSSLPDTNTGSDISFSLIVDSGDLVEPLIKFNITDLPENAVITYANLSMKVKTDDGADYTDDILIYEYDNQTWSEELITWNKFEAADIGDLIYTVPGADWTSSNRMTFNVTSWVQDEFANNNVNVSFFINGTAYEVGTRMDWYSKEEGAAASRPWLNITYEIVSYGINISVYSAVNETVINDWSITFYNGTNTATFTNLDSPTELSYINIPNEITNVTIWKSLYDNVTYSVFINDSIMANLTAWIYPTARGLIDIVAPADGGAYGSNNVSVNITAPNNITGNITIDYKLNDGSWTNWCSGCNGYTGHLDLSFYGDQVLLVRAHSPYYIYSYFYEYSNFSTTFAVYNITIRDEPTDLMLNFTLVDYAELRIYCPNREQIINITSNAQDINVSCAFTEMLLKLKLLADDLYHFRTLHPEQTENPVIFYMIENTTHQKDVNDLSLFISDDTGAYNKGTVRIEKIINETRRDIIEQNLDASGRAILYLIAYDRYFLSIVSNDGTSTRSIGEFRVAKGETSRTIYIGIISPFDYDEVELLYKTIRWAFVSNQTAQTIRFIYNDTGYNTFSVEFWVYNATNTSEILFHDIQFTNDVIFTYNGMDINQTYIAVFEAQHNKHGLLSETRTVLFEIRRITLQIPEEWYTIIVVFVLMFTSLLFGAKAAPWGSVVVSLEAVMFWIFGWFTNVSSIVVLVIALLISVISVLGYRRRET